MIKIIYSVVIIIGLASTALALRCHTCSSQQTPDCADPFKAGNHHESDCSALTNPLAAIGGAVQDANFKFTPTGCLKEKKTITDNVQVISRSCYFGDIKEACKGGEKRISCDVCTGDLCNSSTTTGAFATIIALFAVLVRMMS